MSLLLDLPFSVPFLTEISATTIAGISLWSLALYLSFTSWASSIATHLNRWFNQAERFLFLSRKEFEPTRSLRESLNELYASVLSIIPFLGIGALCNYGIEVGLGTSWTISVGLLACMSCGVYELGRRSSETFRE